VKYVRYVGEDAVIGPEHQIEVSDELAALWKSQGNPNISDQPWPDLPLHKAYIVTDKSQ
jgi:hypothetical protein